MRASDLSESPAIDLAKRLPSLKKHDYNTIQQLMRGVATRHRISHGALRDLFVKQYGNTPDDWVKSKLDENSDIDVEAEIHQFAEWAKKVLNVQSNPELELSNDTEEAQDNHHTGGHTQGDNKIWVYVKNRNLVDILRTVFHELVHVRQGEINMIKPGDSYPGSPIEVMADMLAGKYIKIYGEKHHKIFQ